MFRNFLEIENYVLEHNMKKVVALANAEDEYALKALVLAHQKNIVEAILIGKQVWRKRRRLYFH